MGPARRALIAGLAAVPLAATVSTAVPMSLPALETEMLDEPTNLRAWEIERVMKDPEDLRQIVFAWRNRWISGVCVVWCAKDGGMGPSICGCRFSAPPPLAR
jgi:hypothetical protein